MIKFSFMLTHYIACKDTFLCLFTKKCHEKNITERVYKETIQCHLSYHLNHTSKPGMINLFIALGFPIICYKFPKPTTPIKDGSVSTCTPYKIKMDKSIFPCNTTK